LCLRAATKLSIVMEILALLMRKFYPYLMDAYNLVLKIMGSSVLMVNCLVLLGSLCGC
jgi:hypothetical protein